MSLYEVLVIVALACIGGYAYYLFRKDTRPNAGGEKTGSNAPANSLMFARRDNTKPDKKG